MKDSKFEGGLLGLIGINILFIIMVIFSLGLLVPWAVCLKERWYAKNTVIEGKRLKFVGTGIALLGNYIKWLLLTIITLGFYAFWLIIKMKQWIIANTIFE